MYRNDTEDSEGRECSKKSKQYLFTLIIKSAKCKQVEKNNKPSSK